MPHAGQTIDFDPSVDYYKALGVAAEASADDIKRAYRKLAKQYHPDSTGGDKAKEARFKDVQNAYDVLGDANRKQLYDDIRAGNLRPPRGAYGWNDVTPGFDLGDLFSQFFGGGRPRVRVERVQYDSSPYPQADVGRGRAESSDDVEYKITASDGSWLRVEGSDVHSDVRISFDKAMLGTSATIATVDGKAEVKIPPGTSSGRKLRLRGKGVAEYIGGPPGDHYVTVQIDVVGDLDEEAKKLLTQLAARLRKRKR